MQINVWYQRFISTFRVHVTTERKDQFSKFVKEWNVFHEQPDKTGNVLRCKNSSIIIKLFSSFVDPSTFIKKKINMTSFLPPADVIIRSREGNFEKIRKLILVCKLNNTQNKFLNIHFLPRKVCFISKEKSVVSNIF